MILVVAACFCSCSAHGVELIEDFEDGLDGWVTGGSGDHGAFWVPPHGHGTDPEPGTARAGLFWNGYIGVCINLVDGEMPGRVRFFAEEAGWLGGRPSLDVNSYAYAAPDCAGDPLPSSLYIHYRGPVEPDYPFARVIEASHPMPAVAGAQSIDLYFVAEDSGDWLPWRATALIDDISTVEAMLFHSGFEP